MRDPQFGARATGKLGGWAVGALAIDDRTGPQTLDSGEVLDADRAANVVLRARREFGDSSIGGLVTSRDLGPSFNRVASVDTRLRLNPRWFFDGQAVAADTRNLEETLSRDTAYSASVSRNSRKLTYNFFYQDIGKDFHTDLGFVPRTDIRQAVQFATLRWRPKNGPFIALGPNSFIQRTWDRAGVLQDSIVRYPFQFDFHGQTSVFVRHAEMMERFSGIDFREGEDLVNFSTSYLRWLDVSAFWSAGTRPNFYPPEDIAPFLANYRDLTLSLTFRPSSGLLLDETYIYSHLGARPDTGYNGTIFDNHIVRSRVNYQFNRELSLRVIFDYNAVLSNPSLVALDRTEHLDGDVLMTYLVSPGTALYVGYSDGYDNIALDSDGVHSIRNPTTSTGRQVFVKTSYLLRF